MRLTRRDGRPAFIRSAGKLDGDTKATTVTRRQRDGSIMGLHDALDDGEAQTNACLTGTDTFRPSPKWLDILGNVLSFEHVAGVLHDEYHVHRTSAGRDPHLTPSRRVVNDRVVNEVRDSCRRA